MIVREAVGGETTEYSSTGGNSDPELLNLVIIVDFSEFHRLNRT